MVLKRRDLRTRGTCQSLAWPRAQTSPHPPCSLLGASKKGRRPRGLQSIADTTALHLPRSCARTAQTRACAARRDTAPSSGARGTARPSAAAGCPCRMGCKLASAHAPAHLCAARRLWLSMICFLAPLSSSVSLLCSLPAAGDVARQVGRSGAGCKRLVLAAAVGRLTLSSLAVGSQMQLHAGPELGHRARASAHLRCPLAAWRPSSPGYACAAQGSALPCDRSEWICHAMPCRRQSRPGERQGRVLACGICCSTRLSA